MRLGSCRQVPRLTLVSQTGDQCLLKRGIFLFRLEQLKIGFGWGSMTPIWNGTGLRKPHALTNLRFTHWVPC